MNKRIRPVSNDLLLARVEKTPVPKELPRTAKPIVENHGRWSIHEDMLLHQGVKNFEEDWKLISELVRTRTTVQCRQRWQKVLRPGLIKGQWKNEEDQLLREAVGKDLNDWGKVSAFIPGRTPKQCRERWKHHLDPRLKKTEWTSKEDAILLEQHATLGNKWSKIAKSLPGRTANAVKIRRMTLVKREEGQFRSKRKRKEKIKKRKALLPKDCVQLARAKLPVDIPEIPCPAAIRARDSLPPSIPQEVVDYVEKLEIENRTLRGYLDAVLGKFQKTTHILNQRNLQLRNTQKRPTDSLVSAIRHRAHSFGGEEIIGSLTPRSNSNPTSPSVFMSGHLNANIGHRKIPVPKPLIRSNAPSNSVKYRPPSSSGTLHASSDSRMGSTELLELEGFISRELSDTLKSLDIAEFSNFLNDGVPTPRQRGERWA